MHTKGGTHPVQRKSPNPLGLFDMLGNVYEWCDDWRGPYSAARATDPRGPRTGSTRVVRGGLLTEQPNVVEVVSEIVANQATWGDKGGVTALDFAQVTTSHARIQEIDRSLPAARKMVEILEETRAQQDDLRERGIRSIARSIDARSRQQGNQTLLAKYETTRTYRSEAAMRAVKTLKKNAAEKAAEKAAQNGNGGSGTQPKPPEPPHPSRPTAEIPVSNRHRIT